ncbi:MAG: PhnD/SsuA/transferrin family substrate-binding protein [Gammaproteobacteria bacterium]|nr:PhnD/SsuA/transferrin family substrate-binding protein [Gammaproteobacteria bacterium]
MVSTQTINETETFRIEIVSSSDDNTSIIDCIGSIDVHAEAVLDQMAQSAHDYKTNIHLDFKNVERVNSMGLSLLLKLFDIWETAGKKVNVLNLNRMTSMLFKITGLGRFMEGGSGKKGKSSSVDPVAAPFNAGNQSEKQAETKPSANATMKFIANLQTGQQLSGWYMFNTFLQRKLEKAIHLEQPKLGEDLAHMQTDILFSKPFDACTLIQKNGFVPLARPTTEVDEVVILMREDDDRDLKDLKKPKVVTASQNSFVYILGRSLCDENDMDSESFDYTFAGNEIKALQMMLRKQADVLFILKKTYDGLSSFARGSTRVVDESETNFAFHLFCAAPYVADSHASFQDVLLSMHNDEQGQQILKDIEIDGWCKPEEGELQMLKLLFNQYVKL